MVKGAWVTLATNDSYSLGALVLAHSLKQVGTQQELAILVTPGVTNSMRARLSDVFNIVKEVNVLDSRDKANLRLLQRPELGITFTKLHCWQLLDYEKCVFLDADTLVLQNCDELFEREELSAAPDVGWPDCFNSGVFVYRPSEETYNSLIQFALDKGSFDGGDQGLLNLYFADWSRKDISKHLPFIYNVCSTAFYSYLPAFKQFGKDVKIIHFIGNAKPWLQYFDTESKRVRPSRDLGHLEPILQQWWNIFCSMIHPNLSPDMSGLAGAFAKLTLGQQRTPEQEALEDSLRRQNWEQGNIDYLGKDSFDNIWSKICETLAKGPQEDGGETDLDLASPQQEMCVPPKEELLTASQDSPVKADLSSSTAPLNLSPTDKKELSPQQTVSTVTPTIEPSKNDPITIEQSASSESSPPKEITQPVASSVEKLPSLAEIPPPANLLVEQTKSEKSPSEKETVPILTEKAIPEETTMPPKGPEVSSCPVTKGVTTSSEVPKQDISTGQVTAPLSVPPTQQDSALDQDAKTQQLSQEELACPLKQAPQAESPASEITSSSASPPKEVQPSPVQAPTVQDVPSKPAPPKEVQPSPAQAPPVQEVSPKPSPPKEVQPSPVQAPPAQEVSSKPSSPKEVQPSPVQAPTVQEVSSKPSPPKEVQSAPVQTPTVQEVPSKPSPPKEVQSSTVQAQPVQEVSCKPSPPKGVQPSPVQAPTVQEVPSKPSPPKEVQPSPVQAPPVQEVSSKPSPPKEVQPSPVQAPTVQEVSSKPSPPKEVQPSPLQTASVKEVPSTPSTPKEIQSSPLPTAPVKEVPPTPSPPKEIQPSPLQTAPVKEVPSKPSPPKDVKSSPSQTAPTKSVVPSTSEGQTPPTPPLQVSIPPSADTTSETSLAGAASPVVSPEVPPPIAPPPRKSGGNKKQGKSKK